MHYNLNVEKNTTWEQSYYLEPSHSEEERASQAKRLRRLARTSCNQGDNRLSGHSSSRRIRDTHSSSLSFPRSIFLHSVIDSFTARVAIKYGHILDPPHTCPGFYVGIIYSLV
ncbi:hypothetical protein CEXT_559041 [Caerostris extrusa]|uniref:Uncharacterized protein n=1 Tax=Caerostris extrusa TaxID=172846 RepID=A0AAV4R5L8_CAEEX|nr:hypothetical protein CEXT_559041 [Caerostris extrusa]